MAYTGGESGVGIPIATGGQQTPFGGKQGNGASSETINLKQKIGVTETSLIHLVQQQQRVFCLPQNLLVYLIQVVLLLELS